MKSKLPECYRDVGPGWHALLTAMHQELLRISGDYEVLQVKEKFGGLRAYIRVPREEGTDPEGSREAFTVVARYEALSLKTCETCGQLGENKEVRGWYKTLCPRHDREDPDGDV